MNNNHILVTLKFSSLLAAEWSSRYVQMAYRINIILKTFILNEINA